MSSSRRIKGMVSVGEHTYRIERIGPERYEVVRVNDDIRVGAFKTGKQIRLLPEALDEMLLLAVARAAVQAGRTSWVLHPRPSPPPVTPARERAEASDEAPVSTRLAPA